VSMSDDTECFELAADGSWPRRARKADRPLNHLQDALLQRVVGGTT
jgi:polyphosphate kinase